MTQENRTIWCDRNVLCDTVSHLYESKSNLRTGVWKKIERASQGAWLHHRAVRRYGGHIQKHTRLLRERQANARY